MERRIEIRNRAPIPIEVVGHDIDEVEETVNLFDFDIRDLCCAGGCGDRQQVMAATEGAPRVEFGSDGLQ